MVFLVGLLITLLVIFLIHHYRKSAQYPPGPWSFPILGCLPHLILFGLTSKSKTPMRDFFLRMGTRYAQSTGIFSLCLGTQRFVMIHSLDALKEAFIDNGVEFSYRPKLLFSKIMGKEPGGIVLNDGVPWKVHRRFALMVLRNLGLGKTILEEKIIAETRILVDAIKNAPDKQLKCADTFVRAVSNIICQLLVGRRWEYDDEEFTNYYKLVKASTQSASLVQGLEIFFPELVESGLLYRLTGSASEIVKADRALENIMEIKFENFKETYDGSDEPTCYVEAFIQEVNALEATDEVKKSYFTSDQCVRSMVDLFVAGTDTTTNALAWAMLYLANDQTILHDLQKEIDDTVQAKLASGNFGNKKEDIDLAYADRNAMPYTCAVIDEVQRHGSIVFQGVQHTVGHALKFRGFTIEPRDLIFYNIYHIHHDPALWGDDVDTFRPERFLDPTGKQYMPSNNLVAFGLGKRSCLGEGLARMEFFLFLTSICRFFKVDLADDAKENIVTLLKHGTEGVIRAPNDHHLIFTPR